MMLRLQRLLRYPSSTMVIMRLSPPITPPNARFFFWQTPAHVW